MTLRSIAQADNPGAALVVRTVMTEFGAVGAGYSIEDPEVDYFFEHYKQAGHHFFVIEDQGRILGCGGIAPLKGAEATICELQKMYFYAELRGQGWGKKMLEACLAIARQLQYKTMYLETLQSMDRANALYKKYGFKALTGPEGKTGHGGCDAYYALTL